MSLLRPAGVPEPSPPSATTPLREGRRRLPARVLLAVALALAAALPYLAGGGLESFVNLDDDIYVYDNPVVLKGLTGEGLRWALTTFHASNWHPLTWLSHMADVALFGNEARGHHLVSVLLHALNTSLLFLALLRMTAAPWKSALVAALFGLHPLHVESVAWIAERKDLLSGLFFMMVLLSYERFVRRGGPGRYLLVALPLGLGLMSKPMLVTVPFLLLLLDAWPLGRGTRPAAGAAPGNAPWGRLVVEKLPLLALALASSAVTYWAQRAGGAMGALDSIGVGQRLANAAVSYVAYLGKTLWPLSLAVNYPFPREMLPWWKVGGALVLTAAVTGAAWLLRRRPYLLVGWLWYVGMLVPVIGLVQVGDQAMADRYTYLPLTGIFVMAVWGAGGALPGRWRGGALGVSMGLLLLLSALAFRQAGLWKDSLTLYGNALSVAPGSSITHNNYANALARLGRSEEAIAHYREAIRLRPTYARALVNLGIALGRSGRAADAVAPLREALRIRPDHAEAHYCLGIALGELGRDEEAVAHYREALRLRPDYPEARHNLGAALRSLGRRP